MKQKKIKNKHQGDPIHLQFVPGKKSTGKIVKKKFEKKTQNKSGKNDNFNKKKRPQKPFKVNLFEKKEKSEEESPKKKKLKKKFQDEETTTEEEDESFNNLDEQIDSFMDEVEEDNRLNGMTESEDSNEDDNDDNEDGDEEENVHKPSQFTLGSDLIDDVASEGETTDEEGATEKKGRKKIPLKKGKPDKFDQALARYVDRMNDNSFINDESDTDMDRSIENNENNIGEEKKRDRRYEKVLKPTFDEDEVEQGKKEETDDEEEHRKELVKTVFDEDEEKKEEIEINSGDDEVEESKEKVRHVEDLKKVKERIDANLELLRNFKYEKYSREKHLNKLLKDLSIYYSYNEFLIRKFYDLFSLGDFEDFLEANETARPVTIRANSLKTRRRDLAQALISRGVNLDPVGDWSKIGLVIFDSQVPIGATPEYLTGHYMVQGAASLLPVMSLMPKENEYILDMCAAPGGKTSHIAAMMKNSGTLIANDSNPDRLRAITANNHRLGVINSIICNHDGRKLSDIFNDFDRVLLDAPCSGTGVLSKDPAAKMNRSEKDIERITHLQKELLLSAIDCCNHKSNSGGIIVYSTCSVLVEENEEVIDYALKKRNVKLIDTSLSFGESGFKSFRGKIFHPSLNLTKRYYPHTHNLDGFFVAKLVKTEAGPKKSVDEIKEKIQENTTKKKEKKKLNLKRMKERKLQKKKNTDGTNEEINASKKVEEIEVESKDVSMEETSTKQIQKKKSKKKNKGQKKQLQVAT
ncbi:hypothetical protein SNEBB_002661 [Seison nebaliae]|nr:hypothetical protein SNEBB_002661 [Seison nebaliae]